ncbi:hypothetical protein HK099_003150 [Clydaea vesicula]|uniref:Uncharacterized protein n=1 Tax=Clydaea vesicula TaxID=447962 RepID=A0AAD5U6H2_9FUNG|nr:hypothetical protein HK099_003150 [Clydaea vesicula]
MFVKELESKFTCKFKPAKPLIHSTCIFWKHYLIWSGLPNLEEFYIIYDYLTDPETGKISDGLINMTKSKDVPLISTKKINLTSNCNYNFNNVHHNVVADPAHRVKDFLIGPTLSDLEREEKYFTKNSPSNFLTEKPKSVYIGKEGREAKLLCYQFEEDLTILLFLSPDTVTFKDNNTCNKISSKINETKENVISSNPNGIDEIYSDLPNNRNIHCNYDLKFYKDLISFFDEKLPDLNAVIELEFNQTQKFSENIKKSANFFEIQLKSSSKFWSCGKLEEEKELILVVPKEEYNLIDINVEFQKLTTLLYGF